MSEKDERKAQLMGLFKSADPETQNLAQPLISQAVFLEDRIEYLMTLPMIQVKKDDPSRQRLTPAHKQYKEFMATYISVIRTIASMAAKTPDDATDLVAEFLEKFK